MDLRMDKLLQSARLPVECVCDFALFIAILLLYSQV